MKRVYVNEKWCLGCHLCEYYCAFANTGEEHMELALKNVTIRPRIKLEENNGVCFAVSCRHCKEPLCVKSCITGALSKVNGLISVDKDKCVGCYTCVVACPYGAIMPSGENSPVQKCELCMSRSGGKPACVEHCPNGAIVFEER